MISEVVEQSMTGLRSYTFIFLHNKGFLPNTLVKDPDPVALGYYT